ncbi:hypothetical protein K1Y78_62065, partial [Streptomyces sp. tea 10]|nr:hypothetical protein [Streptomyces sp. tea 10]
GAASGAPTAVPLGVGLRVDRRRSLALVRGDAQPTQPRTALLASIVPGSPVSQWLRYVGSEIIARSADNPYLLSFAVLVGVLLWFNLYGQVLLLAAAVGALVQADIRGARAQPEREDRAVTVVAATSLPDAARGLGHATPVRFDRPVAGSSPAVGSGPAASSSESLVMVLEAMTRSMRSAVNAKLRRRGRSTVMVR